MAPKTLLVFCDGTGMDGSLSEGSGDTQASQATGGLLGGASLGGAPLGGTPLGGVTTLLDSVDGGPVHAQYATNVLRLSRSVLPYDKNGNKQIVFYQSGVGSEANFDGDQVTGADVLQALGTAVASKIRDAYVFIAQNFEDGDEICIFG
ncbi:hypothetical protein E1B28_003697 [Marasmius oreades]|uniref:T6SS Phospholipase effector Tle1-like catalytic domain-containing protein n=1 Tax=Marasmius oreades TaxID=181124 RepID=A0A9P7UX39_9AGAR|nr:uncharacterized protein E1B28_003697 [Marasmius oreades]KAG7096248.1 hypothetical protein E1B28_003697 [Marasmius oreades]